MKNQYDAANMYCTEQIPLMFFFISNQEKVIIILGIRKSIIMMNIQFNRPRKLAHCGEKKENIQINSYSKLFDTRSPVSSSVSIWMFPHGVHPSFKTEVSLIIVYT